MNFDDSPPLDAAFPALGALSPFYPEITLLPLLSEDDKPDWADSANIGQALIKAVDVLMRDLTMAGYRTQKVHLSLHDVAPGQAPVWVTVDLKDRSVAVGEVTGLDHPVVAGNATIHLDLTPYRSASGVMHHVDLAPGQPVPPAVSWSLTTTGSADGYRMSVWVPNATGDNAARMAALETASSSLRSHLAGRLIAVAGGAQNAGLFWLFDPAQWYGNAGPPDYDHLTTQLADWASDIWADVNATAAARGTFLMRQLYAKQSMEAERHRVDVRAKTQTHFAGQAESLALPASEGSRSPLGEAVWQSGYFDLLCMLAQRERITPPLLEISGLVGFWSPPEPPGEAIWAEVKAMDGNKVRKLRLTLFDEPALDITQTPHPDRANDTPDLLRNIAWEFLGRQPDGSYGLAITAGRGVEIERLTGLSWQLRIAWHLAQAKSEIRLPLDRPAKFTPYTWPETTDPTVPTETLIDDLSATAAPRLDHDQLRARQVHELVEADGRQFCNVTEGRRPTLVVSRLDDSGVRFDWYRNGVPQTKGAAAEADYSLTLSPKDPFAGDFGFCWSLDYGAMDRNVTDEDAITDAISFYILEAIKQAIATPVFYGLYHIVNGTTVTEFFGLDGGPMAVGFFRLWYSGEVDVRVRRVMDTDEDFRVEIVKVHDVMRLPEQGTVLPARHAYYGEISQIPGLPLISAMIALWYEDQPVFDDTIPPSPTAERQMHLPAWDAINMPPDLLTNGALDRDKAEHVFVAEPFMVQLYGPSLPALSTWGDVRRFFKDPETGIFLWTAPDPDAPYVIEEASLVVTLSFEGLVVQTAFDVGIGFVPLVGDFVDAAEFVNALATGKDKWGQPVSVMGYVMMGFCALVPGVSAGLVRQMSKQVKAGAAGAVTALVAYGLSEDEAEPDQFGGAGGSLLSRLFMAIAEDAPNLEKARKLGRVIRAADPERWVNLSRADRIKELREIIRLSDLRALGESSGKALAAIAKRGGLRFQDLLLPTGEFRFPMLEAGYKQWAKGRAAPGHGRYAFIQSRVHTSGFWRVLGTAFEFVPAPQRVLRNQMQDANFPHLVQVAMGRFPTLGIAQIVARLANPSALVGPILLKAMAHEAGYIAQYQQATNLFFELLSRNGNDVKKLLGSSNKIRSPEDAYLVVAHLMEVVADAHVNAGHRIGETLTFSLNDFIALGDKVKAGTANALEAAEFEVIYKAVIDLMNKGMGRSRHWHGYRFETRLSVILSGLVRVQDIVGVTLQATIKGLAGPDFIVRTQSGFAVIQAKSYMLMKQLVGLKPAQANEVQAITDLSRLFDNGWRVDGFGELFNGRYICVLDADWLLANGQMAFDKLFDVLGGAVPIARADLDAMGLDADLLAKVIAGGRIDGGDVVFESLDGFLVAAQYFDQTMIDALFTIARTRLADRITDLFTTMADRATLQAMFDAGGKLAERNAKTFAAILNNKAGVNFSPAELMGPGGADIVFDRLKIADGWLDGIGGVPEITVVTEDGLRSMASAAHYARSATP